jgi:hypothetical protein
MEPQIGAVAPRKKNRLLTHSWSWALLEKLPIVQLLKNFPAFYGTRRFTRALHWSLFRARSIQSIPSHPISLRSILILSAHLRLTVIITQNKVFSVCLLGNTVNLEEAVVSRTLFNCKLLSLLLGLLCTTLCVLPVCVFWSVQRTSYTSPRFTVLSLCFRNFVVSETIVIPIVTNSA